MKSRFVFASRRLSLTRNREHVKLSSLVVVVVALCASVLVTVAASAHDETDEGPLMVQVEVPEYNYETRRVRVAPFYETETVNVYNYETEQVRVAPFSEQVDVYNYETEQVRVAPYSATETVDVFNYRTVRVRVAPFTETSTVDVFNYENRQVRYAPYTRTETVDVFNYAPRRVRVAPFTETVAVEVFNYTTVKGACHPMHGCTYTRVRVAPWFEIVTRSAYNYETRQDRVPPYSETRTVDVFNYRTVRVRVAPFTETTTVNVFNYENQRVRYAPYTSTETVDVYNYETRNVVPLQRIAPFSKQVDVFNYETRTVVPRVRVAPFTKTKEVPVVNWETREVRVAPFFRYELRPHATKRVTSHDSSEHVCPSGQYMKPFPPLRFYKNGEDYGFTEALSVTFGPPSQMRIVGTAPVEHWFVEDAHTRCYRPVADTWPESTYTVLGSVSRALENAIEASGDFLVKTIDNIPGSDVINLVLCAYATEQAAVGQLIANSRYVEQYRNGILISRRAFARTNLASAAVDLALENVYCSALERADTTTTTTTTTTVPPTTTTTTTTTTVPVEDTVPTVTALPQFDRLSYRLLLRGTQEAITAQGCTPWVYWENYRLYAGLCPR